MTDTPQFNNATRDQIAAARPDASTWLGANAGSGKTRVLTDRVARLLHDGVDPQNILCLTYTKAAASEMQNRLFKRLGEWAMLDDDALRASLRELGVDGPLPDDRLNRARTLFASAIEAPGGLKIQTIHSFCAGILRRFPLEAEVSPQFTEIEERAAELLRADVVDTMADGEDADLVRGLAQHYTAEDFSKLTAEIAGKRENFASPINWPDTLALFDQPGDLDAAAIEAAAFGATDLDLLTLVIGAMRQAGGPTNEKNAANLTEITSLNISALPILEGIFLTGSGAKNPFSAKIDALPTKPAQKLIADHMPALNDLMERIEQAREPRLALAAAQKTFALHHFAQGFLPRYAAEKQLRGWLDFDDLIIKTRALLSNSVVAAWVLYRIDGGIDHILVDEAQDTSPRQWDVIEKLTDEFGSGQGARDNENRTLFVVGDKKQSIYSFQGADPLEFDRKRTSFEEKIKGAGGVFQRRSLAYSFRSSAAILRVVDLCFGDYVQAGFGNEEEHIAFKEDLPGRVDLWPVVEPAERQEDRNWFDPVDRPSPQHHTVILAEKIATEITRLISGGDTIPDEDPNTKEPFRRAITAGDFLILVQRRSPLFSEIIRACKVAELPIAGADRLKVGAELAVRDLGALLSFLATPEDSLSLATALRSPLFGWSEQALFDLSHRRETPHLWQALRGQIDRYPETLAMVRDLRGQVDFLRPYDLIERILTRHDGRRKLLARLGAEAEDGIDALLSQALAYERSTVPSLTGFLVWMETDDLDIKRQIDSASDQIRVMTVHGAKGLEAPIVILPDCGARPINIRDEVIRIGETPVWKSSADSQPNAMQSALETRKETELQERQRLLYVAMTRAEKWLIVAAAGKLPDDGSSWYQMVEKATEDAGAVTVPGFPEIRRVFHGDWNGLPLREIAQQKPPEVSLDPTFLQVLANPERRTTTISPSKLGGAKALPGDEGEDEDAALSYGGYVHALLEHLPHFSATDYMQVGTQFGAGLPDEMIAAGLAEAQSVLSTPALSHIFGSNSLAEVPVSADISLGRIHGIIDRLLITPDHILAVDFKTNRVVPDDIATCPDGIVRQMVAYAQALTALYPNHRIETAILWTRNATLMVLPRDIVTIPLVAPPHLDDRPMGS